MVFWAMIWAMLDGIGRYSHTNSIPYHTYGNHKSKLGYYLPRQ
jgi:hypothetical protein